MSVLSSVIRVTGTIGTDTTETLAAIDPIYGIDGLRSVTGSTVMYAIAPARRRIGMIVYNQANSHLN